MDTFIKPGLFFYLILTIAGVPSCLGQGTLRGSAVSIDIEPEIGIPLAGYGSKNRRLEKADWKGEIPHCFMFKPSVGRHDAIRSKVIFLQNDQEKLLFISLDMIGVSYRFVNSIYKLLKPLGFERDQLFISATHTHSGPGTLTRKLPLAVLATDLFQRENYDYMVSKVHESILKAIEQQEPVELYRTGFHTDGLQKNKWRDNREYHVDDEVQILLLRNNRGLWLGGMINYAVHGGSLGSSNLKYSADVIGAIERNMEQLIGSKNPPDSAKPTIALFQGALGDAGVIERGYDKMQWIGEEFARQAAPALEDLRPVAPNLTSYSSKIWLGIPGYSFKYANSKTLAKKDWLPPLRIPIPGLMNQRTRVSIVGIGDIIMFTWPGEASTTLGLKLKTLSMEMGCDHAWVLGLTNDYVGYFTTQDEYNEGEYDARSSLFNFRGGRRILKKYKTELQKITETDKLELKEELISADF
ncbi:neutral/alkaline non-lysosomal ceramidase N-terminal domain-containing protein [Fulvivirga ulvae]|uniref:neutral/alkaline non-lysosomal ceramidase N-terminal domain-containing protein n=1 Tax=Fulvivirga ulvae TaxID=2904245 RepID=UPI001F2A12A1|nr:neutral/alkaline non-lysosomal ceramidase N-terminal domain-containing protein [Fulvivirga ulvae]UII31384.1 neutral/alkaline non-lysosomal ceramidase N-terminal domain-containing protein [Fulvivirga ulvae]